MELQQLNREKKKTLLKQYLQFINGIITEKNTKLAKINIKVFFTQKKKKLN